MKKILIIAALAVLPCSLFAQGRVAFANSSTTLITTNASSIGGGTGSTDGALQYKFGLYIGSVGATAEQLTLATLDVVGSPALATNQTSAFRGRFSGGSPFGIAGNNGTPIAFQIRGWSFGYASYEDARAAWDLGTPGVFIGASTLGEVTPATGLAGTPALFGVGVGQVGGFALTPAPVPEPSSIALGLLGLGAIALFRRRK